MSASPANTTETVNVEKGIIRCRTATPPAPGSAASAPQDNGTYSLQVYAHGTKEMLCRPCVDCGCWTGRFCDHCFAVERDPKGVWAEGQRTPLCSTCDDKHDACHFCRGLHLCVPPPHGVAPSDMEVG